MVDLWNIRGFSGYGLDAGLLGVEINGNPDQKIWSGRIGIGHYLVDAFSPIPVERFCSRCNTICTEYNCVGPHTLPL
jgi:hypothetical protein